MAAIKRKKLSDSVIEEIKRMIETGELKEGDKLPNQLEFASQLGVSRPSLREALQILTLVGVIAQKPGMGTVIKSTNLTILTEQLFPPLVSDMKATLELLDARCLIEKGVTALAVKNATEEEIEKMARLIEKMTIALKEDRIKDYSAFDTQFHHCVAIASHNRYMAHTFVTIRSLMEQFIQEAFIILPDLLEQSLKFHIQKQLSNML